MIQKDLQIPFVRLSPQRLAQLQEIAALAAGKHYTLVESFCGAGGLALGLTWAGFAPRFAFDTDELAVRTYKRNLGSHCHVLDAIKATGLSLCAAAGVHHGEVSLFSGGPPCQGFSKQKRGAHNGDVRNSLVLEFARLVDELRPRYFLFENVAIFGQKRGASYTTLIRQRLRDYRLFDHFYTTADYGPAQTRERFVVVGQRRDQKTPWSVPSPTVESWNTVRDAIADLPEPPQDYSDPPAFPNHQRARVTEINIRRFSFVPPGGGWQQIPEDLRLECHKNVDTRSGGWPDVYGRLAWDSQCPTITGGFDSFTRGRYGHPASDRPLTPREAARLQGFPDSFVFLGTRADIRRQIGNAVPPPLAWAIGTEIATALLADDGILARRPDSRVLLEQLPLFPDC